MKKIDRRDIFKLSATTLFFGSLFGAGLYFSPKLKSKKNFLRPPGAIGESEFLATCIKCGQCVQVCPYHSLSLLDINELNSIGTPFVDARKRGCYLCDLFPCILACPSGSLNHDVTLPSEANMGVAFVKNIDICLSYIDKKVEKEDIKSILKHSNKNEREDKVLKDLSEFVGKECTICADLCPYPQKEDAIEMVLNKDGKLIPVIKQDCIGCGVCVELCPAKDDGVLVVIPRKTYSEVYS
ncbi:MAG: 4Fe-4S dicluster domain-containing protein [Campylobacteraceae bacterium]